MIIKMEKADVKTSIWFKFWILNIIMKEGNLPFKPLMKQGPPDLLDFPFGFLEKAGKQNNRERPRFQILIFLTIKTNP